MADSIWWTKMLHKEDFCEHFCEMSDKEIVDDIRKSIASFMKQREEGEDFGAKMVHKAKLRIDAVHDVRSDAGKQGGRPRKDTTADGDTREDSQDRKSGTSANHYGDASHREAEDVRTTFSNNMRRVPQNEAPAHGFSGGRTAQGTMSRSPEAAAQSGKAYDQETIQVSTDEDRESQRRAGADSLRGTPLHSAPARSPARKFRNKEEFIQWAIDKGLDPDDAGNCWEATMERGGLTKDGKKVENLCAYAVKWCRTRKKNRETA